MGSLILSYLWCCNSRKLQSFGHFTPGHTWWVYNALYGPTRCLPRENYKCPLYGLCPIQSLRHFVGSVIVTNGSFAIKKWRSSTIPRVKINKYITLIYFSFTLDFLAEETLNIHFSINLKACCLIKFLISTWYVWVSFFGLILNMKFTSHIVNLGVYTKISARCWTLEWVSFCLLLVTTQRCLSKDRSQFTSGWVLPWCNPCVWRGSRCKL